MNDQRFVHHKFEEERVSATAHFNWFPLDPKQKTDIVFHIVRTLRELNDSWLNIGSFMTEKEDGFKVVR